MIIWQGNVSRYDMRVSVNRARKTFEVEQRLQDLFMAGGRWGKVSNDSKEGKQAIANALLLLLSKGDGNG